jgi:hypothetical protein
MKNSKLSWHVRTEANEVTHRLYVVLSFMEQAYMKETPQFIIDIVCVERFALDFFIEWMECETHLQKEKEKKYWK